MWADQREQIKHGDSASGWTRINANQSEMAVTQQSNHAQTHYRAYLVRLWREDAHDSWRASAQSVQSGELMRFATLQELFTFLEIDTPVIPPADQPHE